MRTKCPLWAETVTGLELGDGVAHFCALPLGKHGPAPGSCSASRAQADENLLNYSSGTFVQFTTYTTILLWAATWLGLKWCGWQGACWLGCNDVNSVSSIPPFPLSFFCAFSLFSVALRCTELNWFMTHCHHGFMHGLIPSGYLVLFNSGVTSVNPPPQWTTAPVAPYPISLPCPTGGNHQPVRHYLAF